MVKKQKEKEVEFYLDRSREAAVTVIKSVASDPRLCETDARQLLVAIARQHRKIAELIDSSWVKAEEMKRRAESVAETKS